MRVSRTMFVSGMVLLLVGSLTATWAIVLGAVVGFVGGIGVAIALEERDYAGIEGLAPAAALDEPLIAPAVVSRPSVADVPHAA